MISLCPALFLSLGLSLSANAAIGAPPSPKPWLEKKVDEGKKLAERRPKAEAKREAWRKEATALVDDMLDWDLMTQKSLGREWKKRTPKEQKEFSALLREMIEASYRSKLKLADNGKVDKPKKTQIKWLEEKIEADEANLTAKVKADKKSAVLGFKLKWDGTRWRVFDVAIDDVSTVRTYRSQFRKLIRERGFPALLERMRSKIEDIRAGRGDLTPD